MTATKDFRFVVRVDKVCRKCGKAKPMFRTQKTCDECRGVKRDEGTWVKSDEGTLVK